MLVLVVLVLSAVALGSANLNSGGLYGLATFLDVRNNTDVVFVIDTSDHIGEADFNKLQSLALKGFGCFGLSKFVRVGLITFTNTATTLSSFDSCTTKTCYREAFGRMKYAKNNKNRDIRAALKTTRRLFKNKGRKSSNKIVILIASGKSTGRKSPVSTAQKLKSMGAQIVVVGFGDKAAKDATWLKRISSNPKESYYNQFTDTLQFITLVEILLDFGCTSVDDPQQNSGIFGFGK